VALLSSRFADTGDVQDISDAISPGESLLQAPGWHESGDPHWLSNAANLAGGYTTHYQHEMRTRQEGRLPDRPCDRAGRVGRPEHAGR
jgi:hypothetical protein